jgi:hypothetical protein
MVQHKYYHYLTLRLASGATRDRIIASNAKDLDEACRERCAIERRHHPDEIVAISTHDCR